MYYKKAERHQQQTSSIKSRLPFETVNKLILIVITAITATAELLVGI